MRTIKDVETITVKIEDKDLIEGKYIPYNIVSKKLADVEKENNYGYKSLRNRLYNSYACNKYNVIEKAGIKCIEIEEPMKAKKASLVLSFERS